MLLIVVVCHIIISIYGLLCFKRKKQISQENKEEAYIYDNDKKSNLQRNPQLITQTKYVNCVIKCLMVWKQHCSFKICNIIQRYKLESYEFKFKCRRAGIKFKNKYSGTHTVVFKNKHIYLMICNLYFLFGNYKQKINNN